MKTWRVFDVFAGVGAFSLGLERAGMHTVAFCESDPYARAVLAKHWPLVPCYDDVATVNATRLVRDGVGPVDVITAGFPCQDLSINGAGAGLEGEQSGLWRECARLIGDVRPRFALVENVAALLSRGLGEVLGSLAAVGYDAEWHCIPASAIGAPHRRDRIWIIATDAARVGMERHRTNRVEVAFAPAIAELLGRDNAGDYWNNGQAPPALCGVDDGLTHWVHRMRVLGNALVPQVAETLGRAMMACDK